jgi:hypothetical protein
MIVMRKRSPINHVKEGFTIKYSCVHVPTPSTTFKQVNKVHSAGLSQTRNILDRITECLHLQPYKITQVQVTEEGNYERTTQFCNGFLRTVHYIVPFSLTNLGSIREHITMLKTVGTGQY